MAGTDKFMGSSNKFDSLRSVTHVETDPGRGILRLATKFRDEFGIGSVCFTRETPLCWLNMLFHRLYDAFPPEFDHIHVKRANLKKKVIEILPERWQAWADVAVLLTREDKINKTS